METKKEKIDTSAMARKGKLDELDRSFDYKFWQAQSATARFAAAHQLVIHYHVNVKGEDADKLRLQRSIVCLKRQ